MRGSVNLIWPSPYHFANWCTVGDYCAIHHYIGWVKAGDFTLSQGTHSLSFEWNRTATGATVALSVESMPLWSSTITGAQAVPINLTPAALSPLQMSGLCLSPRMPPRTGQDPVTTVNLEKDRQESTGQHSRMVQMWSSRTARK